MIINYRPLVPPLFNSFALEPLGFLSSQLLRHLLSKLTIQASSPIGSHKPRAIDIARGSQADTEPLATGPSLQSPIQLTHTVLRRFMPNDSQVSERE